MAKAKCGWCGVVSHMVLKYAARSAPLVSGFYAVTIYGSFTCSACDAFVIGYGRPKQVVDRGDEVAWLDRDWFHLRWLPQHQSVKEFPDVPEHIAQAAEEVHRCHSIDAFRAVGSGARAVVEAVAKDKQITGKNIAEKIDRLADAGHIRVNIKLAAHEIRHFGNDMAHGDFVDEVDPEDARSILSLMDLVLLEVYQSPAEVARMTQRRLAKEAKKSAKPKAPPNGKNFVKALARP